MTTFMTREEVSALCGKQALEFLDNTRNLKVGAKIVHTKEYIVTRFRSQDGRICYEVTDYTSWGFDGDNTIEKPQLLMPFMEGDENEPSVD